MTLPDIIWCEVPAGEFILGSDKGKDEQAHDNETPQQTVYLAAFQIARYPVTNAQFAPFIANGGYTTRDYWTEAGWEQKERGGWTQPRYWDDAQWNLPNHPVVGVSWYEAYAYGQWLSAKTGLTITLPTEAQWEKAARGENGLIYPYGDTFDSSKSNVDDTGIGRTSAVGIFPDGASPCGALDLSGNVWDWCLTKWRSSYADAADDDPAGTAGRVLRGGSFSVSQVIARAAFRFNYVPLNRYDFGLGFRLVWLRPPSQSLVAGGGQA